MDIYFLKSDIFLKQLNENILLKYKNEKKEACSKRQNEYALGRFLVHFILEHYFYINNPQILIKNKKPYIDKKEICFNISHTKNIIAAAFDTDEIGFDIEFMKDRDFSKINERYGIAKSPNEKESFYSFWTDYEAQIKLQQKSCSSFSSRFNKNYWMCIKSARSIDIEKELKVYEIIFCENGNIKRKLQDINVLKNIRQQHPPQP